MNFRSIQDLDEATLRGLPRVSRDVDLVGGIQRSGPDCRVTFAAVYAGPGNRAEPR
ncbi:MAG: hypothetical protein ACYTGD_10765 [Planctomycetota bacterium]|jgi:hypothetical protein